MKVLGMVLAGVTSGPVNPDSSSSEFLSHQVTLAQEVTFVSSLAQTRAGVGPTLGWKMLFSERWYSWVEFGYLQFLGSNWKLGVRGGYQRPHRWSPSIDAGITVVFGQGMEFLSASPHAIPEAFAFRGTVSAQPLRFRAQRWTVSSGGVTLGVSVPWAAKRLLFGLSLLSIEMRI